MLAREGVVVLSKAAAELEQFKVAWSSSPQHPWIGNTAIRKLAYAIKALDTV
jgi:hypothetical protein